MFEVATVRRLGQPGSEILDVGRLLDSALFYGRVHIFMDLFFLQSLIRSVGYEGANSLLAHPAFSTSFTPEMQGVQNNNGGLKVYSPVAFTAGGQGKAPSGDPIEVTGAALRRNPNLPDLTDSEVGKLLKNVRLTTFAKSLGEESSTNALWKSLAKNHDTVRSIIPASASRIGLSVDAAALAAAEFWISDWQGGIIANSSVSLDLIAAPIGKERLTWGHILSDIDDFRTDLFVSQAQAGDLIVDPRTQSFVAAQVDLSLSRSRNNASRISAFNENAFGNGSPIGVAYNSGAISLSDALRLLDRAQKFKDWINGKPADADLLKEYLDAISKEQLFEKLPAVAGRFVFMNGAAVAAALALNVPSGIAAGLALNAFDQFLLGRLLRGWRPNLFVADAKRTLKA